MASADVVFAIKADVGESVAGLRQVEQSLVRAGDSAARVGHSVPVVSAAFREAVGQGKAVHVALAGLERQAATLAAANVRSAATRAAAEKRAADAIIADAHRVQAAKAELASRIAAQEREWLRQSARTRAIATRGDSLSSPAAGGSVQAGVGQATGALNGLSSLVSGKLTAAFAGLGAAIAAAFSVRAIVDFGKMAVAEAVRAEDAANRLTMALNAQGQASVGLQSALRRQAEELQHTTRFSDEAVREMQALALNIGVMPGNLHSFTEAAADLASALGLDIVTAGRQLAQTLDGTAGSLKQMVPELASLTEEQLRSGVAIDVVSAKFRGFAQQDLNTLGGGLALLKNELGESVEAFGIALTGASDFGGAVRKAAEWIRSDFAPAMETMGQVAGTTINFLGGVIDRLEKISAWLPPVWMAKGASWAAGKLEGGGVDENADFAQQVFLDRRKFGAGGQEGAGLRDAAADAAAMEKSRRALADIQSLYKGIIEGAKEQEKAAERAAEQAQQEREALEKKIAGFADQITINERLLEQGEALYGTKADELAALTSAEAKTRSMLEQLREMVLLGGPAGQAAQALIAPLEMSLAGVDQRGASVGMQARLAAGIGNEGGLDLIDPMMAPGLDGAGDPAMQQVQAVMAAERQAQKEAEIQGVLALMDAQTSATEALAEYNYQRDYEAQLSDLVAAGQLKEADALQAAHNVYVRSVEVKKQKERELAEMRNRTRIATVAAGASEISGALSSVAAVTKSTKAKIAIQAAQNVIHGITETAASYAAYARYDAVAGTAHAISAASYFYAASQAGSGGGGGASGGGGGGGGGGKDEKDRKGGRELDGFGGFGGFGSANANRSAVEDAPGRGPTYQVTITGNVTSAGGAEELARMLRGELQRLDSDSGGRATTPRL